MLSKFKINKSNQALDSKTMKKNTALLEHISPIALKFNTKDMVFGELFARGLVIVSFPTKVNQAWLSNIATIPGVICSIHIVPNTEKEELIKSIDRSIGEHKTRFNSANKASLVQDAEDAINDAYDLIRKIREEQNIFYLVVTLFITAENTEELDRKTKKVQSTLASFSMKGRIAVDEQKQILKSVGPWNILADEIFQTGKRNMPAETAAAAFPFVATTLNDGTGVLIGKAKQGKSKNKDSTGLIVLDIWNKKGDRTNSNWVILATSGAGKSFFLKLLCLREYLLGSRVILIDPERESKTLCEMLNGTWINVAGGKYKINPLQVRTNEAIKEADDEDEDEEEREGIRNPLALHLQKLKVFFKLYLQEISMVEEKYLMKAIREVYEDKGIDFTVDPRDLTNEQWPLMEDLWRKLLNKSTKNEEGPWQKLALLIEDAAVGADAYLWNGPTTLEGNSDFIVLDIYDLEETPENVKRAQYYNVLTWGWDQVKRDRNERIIFGVDEGHILVDPKVPEAIQFVKKASKRIRKFEGSLIFSSQNVKDLMDSSVAQEGEAIFNNATYKFLLRQGEKDLEALQELMKLSEAETELLLDLPRGEGLLVAGRQKIHMKVEAAEHELPFLVGGGR